MPLAYFPPELSVEVMTSLQPIRRVIRSRATGKYLKGQEWTEDPDQALHFECISDAIRACSDYELANTELVLRFSEREYDVALPIC